MSKLTQNPLAHTGIRAQRPPEQKFLKRAPTAADAKNLQVGDEIVDTLNGRTYKLAQKPTDSPPTWIETSAGAVGTISQLDGDSGSAVPAAGIINIVGTATNGINVTGAGSVLTVAMQTGFVGDFTFTDNSTGLQILTAQNTNTGAGSSRVLSQVGIGATGDADFKAEIDGGEAYVWGISNADTNDSFVIVDGGTIGAGTEFFKYDPVTTETTITGSAKVFDGISGSFAGSEIKTEQGGVQVKDATPTVVHGYTLATNSAVTITWNFTFAKSDHSSGGGGQIIASARRVAGGAILIGTPIVNFNEDDAGAPTVTAVVATNDLALQFTGIAATTFNCVASANVQPILTNA